MNKNENLMLRWGKVIIRPKREEDSAADYLWRLDPVLCELDATYPITMSSEDYHCLYLQELKFPSPYSLRFAIETTSREHIGNCMCYDMDEVEKQAELGIMIGDKQHWGKGYGRDALNALLRYIFINTYLEKVYLHTLAKNIRAQRSFRKVGMVEVNEVRRQGFHFIYMEMSKQDWLGQNNINEKASINF